MEATAPATAHTIARRDPYNAFCSNSTVFWTCRAGPFIGCCSHDPCHDGYCHDMAEQVLGHVEKEERGFRRRGEASTTTITYTLVRFTESVAGMSFQSSALVEMGEGWSGTGTGGTSSCVSTLRASSSQGFVVATVSTSNSSASLDVVASRYTSDIPAGVVAAGAGAAPTSSPSVVATMSEQRLTSATATASSLPQPSSHPAEDTTRSDNAVTAIAVLNTIPTGVKPAGATATIKPTSQTGNSKSLATSKPTSTTTQSTSTSSSYTSITPNPTAAPVPGAKKSARAIAGITLGAIAALIVVLLLVYCCITSKKRAGKSGHGKKRRRRHSRTDEGVGIVVVKVKDGDGEPGTPMTPGGAKLEAQRGRMLSRERLTGFRALGMTAKDVLVNRKEEKRGEKEEWRSWESDKSVTVPNLVVPTPAMRASEHPASHVGVGMGALSVGLVHPAYRSGHTRSELDLSSLAKQSVPSPANSMGGRRFYNATNVNGGRAVELVVGKRDGEKEGVGLALTGDNRSVKTVSWTAGSDVIDVLVPGPLAVRPNLTIASDGPEKGKPTFDEATAKWAAVVSPSSIGQALSSPGDMVGQAAGRGKELDEGRVAMSTENEVTSPVEQGGLQRPVKRSAFRGFNDLVGGDGKLK